MSKTNDKQPEFVTMRGLLTIQAAEGDSALPQFRMVAYTGGLMRIAGFPHQVVVDLAGLDIPSQNLPIRLDHERRQGVGHTQRVLVEAGQLVAEGLISRDTSWARDVAKSGVNGFPWQASIGAAVVEAEFIPAGATVNVNKQQFTGPVHVVRRAVLKEISFVDIAADPGTTARVAAQDKEPQTMNGKEATMDIADKQQDTEVQARADEGKEAPSAPGAASDPVKDMRIQAVAESKRIAAIRKVTDGKHPDIEARAIEEGWDVKSTELEVLRASRPAAPAAHTGGTANGPKVLEAAALMTGGVRGDALIKTHGEQIVEAAEKRYRNRLGLHQLLLEAAWTNGCDARFFIDDPEAVLRAAFSTFTLPGILSNVANKFLLDGFESVEQAWQRIAATRSVKDFKAVTSFRLTGGFEYQEVGPDGELKHAEVGEESFTNQAKTYGRMFGLTRTDLINDDMDALTAVPRRIGRGGALKLNKVFWGAFLDNAAFFTVGRKNYQAGADTALSIDGLTAAELMFLDQVDPDGNPLAIEPRTLLVPPALKVQAELLMSSLKVNETTTANKPKPNDNPHAGKFGVVTSTYLGNAAMSGSSTKAWYVLAEPSDLPVIEVAFLNGKQQPTVERAEADFNVLGIQFRGYFDFGVALQDYRGGVKMKGEA
ncbi:MAG: hypothetical protein IT446_06535 [Phycisphaerales bacterium]|nr:hypothetical protein [Phycisphaerales bacterium]